MKKNFLVVMAVAMTVALLSCSKTEEQGPAVPAEKQETAASAEPEVFVPGVVKVLFDDEMIALIESDLDQGSLQTKSTALNAALEDLGITSYRRVFPVDPEFEDRHRAEGLHKWYYVHYDENQPETKAASLLKGVPGIHTVRPVYKIKTDATPIFNDPYFNRQWHYDNSSTTWADINVLPVWKNYTTGNSAVIVSVIDGGIDPTHEDLIANFLPGGENGSKNFMTDNTGYRIVAHDHGTHVAGTIAAVNNNGKGVVGIAGGDAAKGVAGVKLMSCQIFQDGLRGADSEAAIVWGADHGAVVSNNSWGYDFKDNNGNYNKAQAEASHNFYLKSSAEAPDAFKAAVDYFNKYAGMKNGTQTGPMAGGVVFFAAGNDGRPYGPPGCYPGCMSVGAMTSYGTRSNFSNYGDWVDIAAPGVDVLSTVPGNAYATMSGTSMACPHVTGVAALVVSYCGGPGFTREMLWDKLIYGGNNADLPSSYRIGPLVDALGALSYGTGEPPQPVTSYSIDKVMSNNVTLTLTVPADADGQPAYGMRVLASKSQSKLQSCDPRNPGNDVVFGDLLSRETPVGGTVTGTVSELDFNASYYLTVCSFDYGRNFSAISDIKTLQTGGNHTPTITTTYDGDYCFHAHDNFLIPFIIEDPDGHVVTVEYNKDVNDPGALLLLESTRSGEYNLRVTGNMAEEGNYTATLTASDNYGLSVTETIHYTILPNAAPVVLKPFDNVLLPGAGEMETVNTLEFVEDPDGEILSWTINVSDPSVVHVTQVTGSANLLVTALSDSGLANVSLSAKDAGNKEVQGNFQVLVRGTDVIAQAYPNPVSRTLYVATGEEITDATIRLYSAAGQLVIDTKASCSAFHPAEVNVKSLAPGRYQLRVDYEGKEYKTNIIKK